MSFFATHEIAITWALFGLAVLTVVLMCWRESRPRKSLEVSIWPTTPFLLAGAFVAILAVVHLFTLYGINPR